jgi:hypothetical protein
MAQQLTHSARNIVVYASFCHANEAYEQQGGTVPAALQQIRQRIARQPGFVAVQGL